MSNKVWLFIALLVLPVFSQNLLASGRILTARSNQIHRQGKDSSEAGYRFLGKLTTRLFDILNLKEVFDDIKEGKVSSATCYACKFGMTLLQHLLEYGKEPDNIAAIAKKVCVTLHIEDAQVCDGAVDLFKDEFVAVFAHVVISPSEICGITLGESCAKTFNPLHNWTVTFPPIPKPPVAPKVPQENVTRTMKILQISDTHVDHLYVEGGEVICGEPLCCRNNTPTADLRSGYWGEYRSCDIPLRTLEQLLKHISKNHPDIDIVFWTGDIPPHDIWRQTKDGQLTLLREVSALIDKYLGSKLIIPALGNHESVPVNSFPPPFVKGPDSIDWLYDELVRVWSKWLPKETMDNVKRGAFFSMKLRPKLKLISLNMNYCNNQNWWLLLNSTDPAGELEWLIHELQLSEVLGEKVHIIGHIPPGNSDCLSVWSKNYYKIINRYESTVVAQYFGHTHQDEFQVFYDEGDLENLRATSVAFVSPSVTTFGYLNPGYRIYTVDDTPNSAHFVLDHETYYLNLTDANDGPKAHLAWNLSYRAVRDLGLKSMEPQEWHNLVVRMVDNEALFQKFYSFFYNRSDYLKFKPCTTKICKMDILCRLVTGRALDPKMCSLFQAEKRSLSAFVDK